MKKQGKIKHAGFSFHSTPEELDEILTKHPEMEFVQLQINYAVGGHGLKSEQVCPQHISIRSELEKVVEAFNG